MVSWFTAACPGGSLENMASIPSDILVAKGASVLAGADLENAWVDLAQTRQSVEPLMKAAAKFEEACQAALVDARQLERCLNTETVRELSGAALDQGDLAQAANIPDPSPSQGVDLLGSAQGGMTKEEGQDLPTT
ncbi:hypothetical protein LWI29_017343 [Acer saccharum]|uniref:Uncharacterized protein n=1 Tax=Acer saccharum TaxID=4024 RepID=A0AA39RS47_ACESA|nr:hypothetical protein LWI29_017343 [Acer saccharum]